MEITKDINRVASIWDKKADDFREAADLYKGSQKLEDIMSRASLLELAEKYEAAGKRQRQLLIENSRRGRL